MNDIRVVLRLFDVSPSINKFLMLSMKVLQGPLDGRTSFVSRKLHLGSNDCTPKARMAAYKCAKLALLPITLTVMFMLLLACHWYH